MSKSAAPDPQPAAHPTKAWLKAIAGVVAFYLVLAALALWVDQPLAQWFDQPNLYDFRIHARDITNIGLAEHWFAIAAVVFVLCQWILPRWAPRWRPAMVQNMRLWSVHLFGALCSAGIILLITKFSVGRQRPHISPDHDALTFVPFSWHWHWQSFPSGHSQTLFCVAACLALLWPKMRWPIYTVGFLLALTRVIILQHFLSDMIGGIAIGIIGAYLSFIFVGRRIALPKPWNEVN